MTSAWQSLFLLFSVLFIIYHLISARFRWILLLISSLFFLFVVSGPLCFIYTIIFVFISFLGAYLIDKVKEDRIKFEILTLTVVTLFMGLLIFKFTNVIIPVNVFISKFFNIPRQFVNSIIIPVGISYYTLILIAYVVDVYRKVTVIEKNFFKYLLFTIYFPQLLMGPIVRHNDTKEQLISQKPIDFSYIQFGILRILWGITKKIVIADRLAIITNQIFSNYSALPNTYIISAIVLFTLQLYIDFSSAMDIGLGISSCLGIKLPENFNNPFFSRSYHQFWQRWHITIFTFYRDYIFYPVIRSKFVKKIKTVLERYPKINSKHIPIFIAYIFVFIFAGVWHGGDSRAMLGNCLLPCIYLMIEDIFHYPLKKIYNRYKFIQKNIFYSIFQMIGVFILFCICVLFFAVQSVNEGFSIISQCFFYFNIENGFKIILMKDLCIVIFGLLAVLVVDILKENKIDIKNFYITKIPVILHWCIISAFISIIILFGLYGPNYSPTDFVYFKF